MPACPAGSVQQQVMQQYSYLFQMAQQLNLALEQLEQREHGTGDAAQAEQRYRKLRRSIAAAAERSSQALTALLAGEYVAAADFGQCAEALCAEAEASPQEADVTPLRQRIAALEQAVFAAGGQDAAAMACLQVTELAADSAAVGPWSIQPSGNGLAIRWIGGQT